jgi:predicted permease
LLESLWLAFLASALGALFAWWSAPLIVRMINPPDHPLRLALPLDWRVFGFGVALTVAVTLIFGLAPALRASAVRPLIALKGGDEPVSRNRLMHVLIAAQVAFCFLVLFVAGLFVATLSQLSNRTTGFSAERLLTLDTVTRSPQPPQLWEQVIGHLRAVPGVETVAVAGWPLLTGGSWNGVISVNGAPPDPELVSFLNVSPGWLEAMKIPLIDGRDFRAEDTYPGVAIVNKAFAMHYFDGQDPIGSIVEKPVIKGTGGWAFARADGTRFRLQIVGLVGDARYHDIREANTPIAYVPFRTIDDGVLRPIGRATLIVRTSTSNPLALASILRQEVTRARSEFRVSNIRTQLEINQAQTVRERLIATLAVFFAGVALLLAGVGLYGVLNYSVIQRRREFGIRMAVGAQAGDIARQVTMEVFWMVITGAIAGVAFGTISVRFIEALLYQVKTTDTKMLAAPALTILLAALIAALPPVIRAVRINPSLCLRTE